MKKIKSNLKIFDRVTRCIDRLALCRYSSLAFTLAEALITLAIIGVVAVLILPPLISKYEKLVIETGLKKTYSELQNAFNMAEAEYGPFAIWDYSLSTPNFVNKYFAPYLGKLTPCDKYHTRKSNYCMVSPNNIFSTYYRPTSTSKPGEPENANSMSYYYLLEDGRVLGFYAEVNTSVPRISLDIIADVNGNRGRTVMGQDVFSFSISSFQGIKNRLKAGSHLNDGKYTNDWLKNNCIKNDVWWSYGGKMCVILLERNGWRFPDDYPIKF